MRAYLHLAAVKLIEAPESAILGDFIDSYIHKSRVKESTKDHYNRVKTNLVDFFGRDRQLRSITAGDAKDFRQHLLTDCGENTVRRRCGRAKQFFKDALSRGLIDFNPFDGQKVNVGSSAKQRQRFVTRPEADAILEACPNAQWRLIFALNRFGGLRCPSEVLLLERDNINWDTERIAFRSIKTEHHEGGETRTIPIFPELVKPLMDVLEQSPVGTTRLITRYEPGANLRTQFNRIVKNAGLEPWAKPFQNLRSTRETELASHYPIHVVCDWIGNSPAVAMKHYLQVTDDHFAQASNKATEKVATIVATQPCELGRIGQNGQKESRAKTPVLPGYSAEFRSVHADQAPRSVLYANIGAC